MLTGEKQRPILVADPNHDFYKRLMEKSSPGFSHIKFELVQDAIEALERIKEDRNQFSALVLSPDIAPPAGVGIIKCSLIHQPTTPIIYIKSMIDSDENSLDFERLGVSSVLGKPFRMKDLSEQLGPEFKLFDSSQALEVSSRFKDKVDQELDEKEQDFRPIKAELFISGNKSLFDVYVKLRADKFVKIVQAGDEFEIERVNKYLEKGITHFYIRKEAQASYVSYCDTLSKAVTSHKNIDEEKKVSFLFNQAEVTLNALHELGINNDSVLYAQNYIKNVGTLINNIASKNDLFANLLKKMSQFEHSASVVAVSAILGKEHGMESIKGARTLGMAAFLHDVGMSKLDSESLYAFNDPSKNYLDEEMIEEKLSSNKIFGEEKEVLEKIYREHCERGVDILSKVDGIEPVILQIVAQHHSYQQKERGTFKGGPIHPLAEIVEISDDFVKKMNMISQFQEDKEKLSQCINDLFSRYPGRLRDLFLRAFQLKK